MLQTLAPPPIPFHESLLNGITINIESFADNLAFEGRGDFALEDWFWQITIENIAYPFCTVKGFWGLYVVRSLRPIDLKFNTNDHSSVIQLWPGDEPMKFTVEEDTFDGSTGICLVSYYQRPDVGTIRRSRGLYEYHSA